MGLVNLAVALRVTEQASRPLRRAADAANVMADKTDKMTSRLRTANSAMLGMVIAADAAVGLMAASAASFEQAMARLETVTKSSSKTINTSLADSANAARSFSTQFSASAGEIVKAQFEIATAGVAINEQIAATQAAFKLARATMGEFTQSAQVLGSFLNTFGKTVEFNYLAPADKMEAITDRLSESVRRFQVTLPVLAESFKFIVGPASQLNLKLSEVASAIGVLNTAGFRGTLAGTALSNMFNKLNRATDKLNLDPDKFIDLNGNLKSLVSFLREVNRALADKTPIEAQNALINVFDIRAGRVAKTLLINVDAIARFAAEMDVSRGATERMANTVETTTTSAFLKLRNAVENTSISIGQSFNQALQPIIGLATSLINVLNRTILSTDGLVPAFIGFSAILLTTSVVISGVTAAMIAMKTAMAAMTVGSKAASAAVLLFKFALTGGIFAAAAAAIFSLAAGAVEALKAFQQWSDGANSAANIAKKIETNFGSASVITAKFADEISRLNAAAEAGVKTSPKNADLGGTDFANEVERLVGQNVQLDEAVKRAFKSTDGFMGALRNLATSTGESVEELNKLYTSFANVKLITDRTFESLSELARFNEFGKQRIDAFSIAVRAMGDGTEQGGKSIANLANQFANLKKATNLKIPDFKLTLNPKANLQQFKKNQSIVISDIFTSIFDSVQADIDNLRLSPNKLIQNLVGEFDKRKFNLNPFKNSSDPEFRKLAASLINIDQSIIKTTNSAQRLAQVFDGASTAMTQSNRAAKSIKNILKRADLGGETYAKAFKTIDEEVLKARNSLEQFVKILPKVRSLLKDTKNELGETGEFKALEKIADNALKIETNLRFNIDTADATAKLSIIRKQIENEFGSEIKGRFKQIEKLSSVFKGSIQSALSGGLNGKKLFSSLADDFKKSFSDSISKDISTRISGSFEGSLTKAKAIARDTIKSFNSEQLKNLGESGVADAINKNINLALPELKLKFGGDLLDGGAKAKIVKQIEGLGSAFASTIGKALTGALKNEGKSAFSQIGDDFKNQLLGGIQNQLGGRLKTLLAPQLQDALKVASSFIEKLSEDDILNLDFTKIGGALNSELLASVAGLQGIVGPDIFDFQKDNGLAKAMKDASVNASVAIVSAGNRTAAILREFKTISSQGPADTLLGLNQQATRYVNLIKEANRTGGSDAVKFIEPALKGIYESIQQLQSNSGPNSFTSQARQGSTFIERASTELQKGSAALVDAGEKFLGSMTQAFNIKTGKVDLIDSPKRLDIEFSTGTRKFEISIDKTGAAINTADGLDEEEIRRIVNEASEVFKSDTEESLRILEDQLRNR